MPVKTRDIYTDLYQHHRSYVWGNRSDIVSLRDDRSRTDDTESSGHHCRH
ncbi:hypothetical protein ABZ318_15635 [Streptomyces sp. NPDC006197]